MTDERQSILDKYERQIAESNSNYEKVLISVEHILKLEVLLQKKFALINNGLGSEVENAD
jgi:hypothetical protein